MGSKLSFNPLSGTPCYFTGMVLIDPFPLKRFNPLSGTPCYFTLILLAIFGGFVLVSIPSAGRRATSLVAYLLSLWFIGLVSIPSAGRRATSHSRQ